VFVYKRLICVCAAILLCAVPEINFVRWLNSLPAIDYERQRFNELHGTVVSRRIFIRSQSLIAR
jgi:hypothetical protein